jgi:superfamily II DNA or RNA helicase
VICPTQALKGQWADEADRVSLHIDPTWDASSPDPNAADFVGVVSTYQAVSMNSTRFRSLCRVPTFVILDEIHHAGTEKSWGDSLRDAFDPAVGRLLLSGTPFRQDNRPIPWVRYENGKSQADFIYSYGAALEDDVCRPVFFPSYEGDMRWYANGSDYQHTFQDTVADDVAAKRLKTALNPSNEWLKRVIVDANRKLTEIRESHANAGGLVVCIDGWHAEQIASLMEKVTGDTPALVLYDKPESNNLIREFAGSRQRWIVAVRMVSEGIDIKRLRVGIYATNVLTELFFRQVIGRFVRVMDGIEDQHAHVFIPADPVLQGYAEQVKQERDHQLEEELRRLRQETLFDDDDMDDKVSSSYVPISADGRPDDVVLGAVADRVTQEEIAEAERYRIEAGIISRVESADLARLIRVVRGHEMTATKHTIPPEAKPEPPKWETRASLRKVVQRFVGRLAAMTDQEHKNIYTSLMKIDGVNQREATIVQLQKRVELLQRWIKEARNG